MNKIENSINIDGACHLWTGAIRYSNERVTPYYRGINIRKYLWNLSNDEKLSLSDSLITTCNEDNCVNLDHLQINSREIIWEEVWERLKNNIVINDEGCMLWNKTLDGEGYGTTNLKSRYIKAHRLSYMIKIGGKEIPEYINGEKTVIRHSCRWRNCINPDHLDIGTNSDNCKDRIRDGTANRGDSSHLSKIKESLAREIKLSRREKGESGYKTQKERAKIFRVQLSTVRGIDIGHSWAYLPDINGKNHTKKKEEKNTKRRMNTQLNRERELTNDDFEKIGDKLYSNITKTSKNKRIDIEGDCWERNAPRTHNDYTKMVYGGVTKNAHVWSCERSNKRKRLDNEETLHICGNNPCVNPSHLRFGTSSENALDSILHGTRVTKLDKDKVLEIRKSSLSRKELSEIYMVSIRTIDHVIAGKTWKHIE